MALGFTEHCINELFPSVKRDFDVEKTGVEESDYMNCTLKLMSDFFLLGYALEFFLAENVGDRNLEQVAGVVDHRTVVFIFRRLNIYREEKVTQLLTPRTGKVYCSPLEPSTKS
jgi:hypothetical protein